MKQLIAPDRPVQPLMLPVFQNCSHKMLVFSGRDPYAGGMVRTIALLLALSAVALAADLSKDEDQIWNSEKAYWEYVKANDLEKYRALWRDDFVGWPSVSPEPVHKDHITDWITDNTAKGLKLQSYSIEERAVHVTGDVAIDHYRIKANWAKGDSNQVTRTDTVRITHTWLRTNGTWQILGGMSAPVNAEGK
jgi:ketosteroid isomerase-like protein